MNMQLFGYDCDNYCDLDDAQEDQAIICLLEDASKLTSKNIDLICANAASAFDFSGTKFELTMFFKIGGLDYSYESIKYLLENNDSFAEIAQFKESRKQFESNFIDVRAVIWFESSEHSEVVWIGNKNRAYDYFKRFFYKVNNLSELETYMKNTHQDGWLVKSYSVIN